MFIWAAPDGSLGRESVAECSVVAAFSLGYHIHTLSSGDIGLES